MTSFGYRFNPRYAIKECSSCGTLYTRDCVCSMGTVEDKILVPKSPKNYARCTRCGYLVDGPNCQGCALLHQELEENLVTYSPDFQNSFEPSNASTNIVNAPREPYVVKQDNGRLCYICGHNQNSLNYSPSISETSSQSPPNINHYCYECGDPLDGIFCKRCTCKSCGKDAHIGYNCPSNVPIISNPEPCNNQTIDELPQALPSFHSTFHSEAESPFTLDPTLTYVDESPNVFNPPQQPPVYPCEFCGNDAYYGHYCTPQAPFIYPEPYDNIISGLPSFSAITPDEPVLSTEEPDNSLSMGDEHLDTIPAMKSDEFIKSGVETLILIPSESEGITKHMCDVPFLDNSLPLDVSKDQFEDLSESNKEFSSTDDDSFSLDNIDYVEASPPDSELVSSEVMEIVIPEVGGIKASNDNLIPFHDPIISRNPPNFTPSGESDLFLDVDAFLAVEDEFTSSQFPKSCLGQEGDMLLFEAFLNDDHSSDFKTKSSSTSLNSLLEETNNFDNSLPEFTTFSKVLFDAEYESDSSDDQSCSDEDVLEKIVSKPPSEEEIIPMESLRTHDSSFPIFDSIMEEIDLFCTPDYPMPLSIKDKDCDSERDILI
nr:hypothetical protein [Tanacetum cinerariifolium]